MTTKVFVVYENILDYKLEHCNGVISVHTTKTGASKRIKDLKKDCPDSEAYMLEFTLEK